IDVRGERIQIGAESGLRCAERLVARASVEVGIGHEAGATKELTDVTLEVLHFIEVAAPVQRRGRLPALASQRLGVAQTFAAIGEVPDLPVAVAVDVAARAT